MHVVVEQHYKDNLEKNEAQPNQTESKIPHTLILAQATDPHVNDGYSDDYEAEVPIGIDYEEVKVEASLDPETDRINSEHHLYDERINCQKIFAKRVIRHENYDSKTNVLYVCLVNKIVH